MTTLQDLLERAKLVRDVTSGRALGAMAERDGFSDYRTQINQILKGTYKSRPSRGLLEAIAYLAMVDVERAYAAADQPLPGPPFAEELPPGADYLLPHERQAVVELVRAFLVSHTIEHRADLTWADKASLSLHMINPQVEPVEPVEPESTGELSDEQQRAVHEATALANLAEAARRTPTGEETPAQRRRRELGDLGEESQDPGSAETA